MCAISIWRLLTLGEVRGCFEPYRNLITELQVCDNVSGLGFPGGTGIFAVNIGLVLENSFVFQASPGDVFHPCFEDI